MGKASILIRLGSARTVLGRIRIPASAGSWHTGLAMSFQRQGFQSLGAAVSSFLAFSLLLFRYPLAGAHCVFMVSWVMLLSQLIAWVAPTAPSSAVIMAASTLRIVFQFCAILLMLFFFPVIKV